MAASPKAIIEYSACTVPTSNDYFLGVGNNLATTFLYKIEDIFTGMLKVTSPPANSNSGGYPNNSFFVDDNYLYRVTSNGQIKRIAFSTF